MKNVELMIMILCAAAISVGCNRQNEGTPHSTLDFYIVSGSPIPNGRYVSTEGFPKLGYLSETPAMSLSRLGKVELSSAVTHSTHRNADGTVEDWGTTTNACINLSLGGEAERMHELTKSNIGKQIALMLDGEILMAPFVRAPIDTGEITITGDGEKLIRVHRKLETLTEE